MPKRGVRARIAESSPNVIRIIRYTNECPVCKDPFAETEAARHHAAKALENYALKRGPIGDNSKRKL